jgi:phosphoglycerate dehydrogenase-like enzyme
MSPAAFETAIGARSSGPLEIRTHELPWPDEPMRHRYATPGLEGLKEYQGEPDEILRWIGDAEIVVTQLAPFSMSTLERLPNLKLIAVARGAALETFAVEPTPPDLELLKCENVTLTPHIAGASLTTAEIAAEAMVEEIRRHLAGQPPLNPATG